MRSGCKNGVYGGYNSYIHIWRGLRVAKTYFGDDYTDIQNSTINQNGCFLIGYSELIGSNSAAKNKR